MSTLIKTTLIIFLGLSSATASATTELLYVNFYFNLRSISNVITDKQCEDLFKISRQYTIVNDKVFYKPHPDYTISNYKRTNVTYLNKTRYLFTGVSTITFTLDGKTQTAKEDVAFVLTVPDQRIQGSFILDGYCKGNLIGVNQNDNLWPQA